MKKTTIGSITVIAAIITIYTFYMNSDESENSEDSIDQVVIHEAPKSDEEIYLEAGKQAVELGLEIGKGIKENKQRKDSIYKANRTQQWVFQLGGPMDSKEAVLEMYKQLEELGGVSVFKEARKRFFVFVDYGLPKQAMQNSLDSIKERVGHITPRVSVIDLMNICGKRKRVIKTDSLSIRNEDTQVECYECN